MAKNIETRVQGEKLVITIDLTQNFGLSGSGKSLIIASTEGNISVPGREDVKMANRLCSEIGHAWQHTTIKGWFRCARAGCGAYGACAVCVCCVYQNVLSQCCVVPIRMRSVLAEECERREVMRYRVYLWLTRSSQAADVVQEEQASTAPAALQEVMRSNSIPFVYYAWVVPESDALPCMERYQVRCALAALP